MSPRSSCTRVAENSAVVEHAQRQAGRFHPQHATASDHNRGTVAGVMDFNFSRGLCLPAHQRGVLPGQRAFTEDAVDLGDNLAEREIQAGQAAE